MSGKTYIYSTLASPQLYTNYGGAAKGAVPQPTTTDGHPGVLINGGAGVADKRTLLTPRGAVTEVSEDQLKYLMQNSEFKAHVDRGFITMDDKKVDPEIVAPDMSDGDQSAQLTDQDFEEEKEAGTNVATNAQPAAPARKNKRK